MCFFIHNKFDSPITATEDIRCYKLVMIDFNDRNKCNPVYMSDFLYERNVIYKLEGELKKESSLPHRLIVITKGFHSYESPNRAYDNTAYCHRIELTAFVETFVIPKGSLYYRNPATQEYVSNQIYWE